jgi:formylmethanofuran dehydrogenase subunit B
MGVIKYRSKYPVIHQAPGLGLLFRNMNAGDWTMIGSLTAVSFPVGYWIGSGYGKGIKSPMMWMSVLAASTAGLTAGMMRSAGRILGLQPNQAEAAQYKYRLDFSDYQVRTEPFRTVIEEELQEIQDNPRY